MATSTEATVRSTIIAALRAESVAQTILKFDKPEGNIKDYLIDHETRESIAQYLGALVDGKMTVRCWAVEVLGNDDWFAQESISKREYQITLQGYYAMGVNGSGAKTLIDHSNGIRNMLRGMGPTISGTVTRVARTGRPDIRKVSGLDSDKGEILVGTIIYVCERTNPDFYEG